MDHGHKRATEQDRYPSATISAPAQQEEDEEGEEEAEEEIEGLTNKRPCLNKCEEVEVKVAEEDEDSEPSDEEDN